MEDFGSKLSGIEKVNFSLIKRDIIQIFLTILGASIFSFFLTGFNFSVFKAGLFFFLLLALFSMFFHFFFTRKVNFLRELAREEKFGQIFLIYSINLISLIIPRLITGDKFILNNFSIPLFGFFGFIIIYLIVNPLKKNPKIKDKKIFNSLIKILFWISFLGIVLGFFMMILLDLVYLSIYLNEIFNFF